MKSQSQMHGAGLRGGLTVAHWLWIAAAVLVLAGFLLRVLASFLSLPELRILGMGVIALGLFDAVFGWVVERLTARRRR